MVPRHDPPSPRSTPVRFGRFRVEHEIGFGSLGPVLQARESHRDRLVAIKAFTLEMTAEQADEVGDRLAALTRARLSHPSLVRPITAGVEAGTPYLVQEFVFGESLDVALRRYGPAPAADAARLVAQLASALSTAAAANAPHGALHPKDVLVTPDLVRVTGVGVRGVLRQAGMHVPGRRLYSAPECDAGMSWDARADVFSLAAIIWELVTGRPFVARLGDTLPRIDRVLVARPDEFERALSRALSVSPDDRQATVRELAVEVEAALTGRVVHTTHGVDPVADAGPAGMAGEAADAPPVRSVQPMAAQREEDLPAAAAAVESPVEPAGPVELEPIEATGADETLGESVVPAPGVADAFVEAAGDLPLGEAPVVVEQELVVEREPTAADLPFDDALLEPEAEPPVIEPRLLEPGPVAAVAAAPLAAAHSTEDLVEELPAVEEPEAGDAVRIEARAGDAAAGIVRAPADLVTPVTVTAGGRAPQRRRALTYAVVSVAVLGVGLLGGYFAIGWRPGPAATAPAAVAPSAAPPEAAPPNAPSPTASTPQGSAAVPAASPAQSPPLSSDAAGPRPAQSPAAPGEAAPAPPRTATPATGEIIVRSVPDGAGIFLDGALRGYTPRRLRDLPLGRYAIRVTRRGYVPGEASVTLTPAKTADEVRFDLVPRAATADAGRPAPPPGAAAAAMPALAAGGTLLAVRSEPPGARVFVDDQAVGVTPLALSAISSGLHVVRVEREGYRRWSIAVRVAPGRPARVEASLQREPTR